MPIVAPGGSQSLSGAFLLSIEGIVMDITVKITITQSDCGDVRRAGYQYQDARGNVNVVCCSTIDEAVTRLARDIRKEVMHAG